MRSSLREPKSRHRWEDPVADGVAVVVLQLVDEGVRTGMHPPVCAGQSRPRAPPHTRGMNRVPGRRRLAREAPPRARGDEARMKRGSSSDPQPPLRCHLARAGMNPSRIAASTFAPRSRWLAPRSAHQMMAGAAPGTSTRPTALDLEGHRAQPPDTSPEGSAPLRTGTQTQGPRNRDTMVEPSQGSACLAERERSFRCRTRRHTGLNPRRRDR